MTEQSTAPPPLSAEPALLQRLRDGEDAAFGELFELHAAAVRRLALGLASDRSEAEDITAETFFRVLQALRRGSGPRDNVRAYLLTVARRVSWEWHGARRDVPVSEDELTHRAGAGADAHARTAEHTLITRAFTSLPERWRTVLWQTEVEGEQPAVVAPHFGLSANATAALARRARQGLRAAYLQAHLSVHRGADGCRAVIEKLGGYTAGSVTGTEARRIQAHLLGCASCRATADELREVCSSLRAHSGVIVLLLPASALTLEGLQAGGLLAGLKGLLVGSKMKVGMALASTAAAGVVGVAVGPMVDETAQPFRLGLPGLAGQELIAAEPAVVPPPGAPRPPMIATESLHNEASPLPGQPHQPAPPQPGPGELPALPGGSADGVVLPGERDLPGTTDPGDEPMVTDPNNPDESNTPRDDVEPYPDETLSTTETAPETSEPATSKLPAPTSSIKPTSSDDAPEQTEEPTGTSDDVTASTP
ncbi:sigma-70 family RNA polymerase sigma factor [Amycolatopsis sp. 195334CR]|uniref:sigma-70 family RNA polymerase sigma factor n=1 Tax=Amycolatopsis sp. 195334CR TaxID=2814588 RepID=UPI001A8E3A8E|nr:sigma-70 family RNA polymerase sigma factor [Amycolatopsis sp. 195334CR]MBN6035458.1 sigma-70 family RNA polymerase sigma factor [Amycolatopsis sp. 195334CR]